MMRPENLFNNTIVFPVESSLFRNFPAKAKLINQIQETIIVASVKAHFHFLCIESNLFQLHRSYLKLHVDLIMKPMQRKVFVFTGILFLVLHRWKGYFSK